MSEQVNYVDAEFGGETVRFEILRDDLPLMEAGMHNSAYALLRRIADGQWTYWELTAVLSAALWHRIKTGQQAMVINMSRRSYQTMGIMGPSHFTNLINEGVATVLRDEGPAHYAPLALKVLEAALFGISEDEAQFKRGEG